MNSDSNIVELDCSKIKDLYVIKRDGKKEEFSSHILFSQIRNLCDGLNIDYLDPREVTKKIVDGIYDNISTVELDNLAAEVAASLTTRHPDYCILGGRIAVSSLHKHTKGVFSEVMKDLYNNHHPQSNVHKPKISKEMLEIVLENSKLLDSCINYERDFNYNYFGFKTLERSYLLRIQEKVVERPQEMLLRAAIGIHKRDLTSAIQTYNMMSEGFFTHSSATLFNAGSNRPQLSSCFLLTMMEDSIDGIFETLKKCALISKSAASIGLNIHTVRASGSPINGINGVSDGIVPMLRVFNNTAKFVTQGGNKRPGAFAVFLEPWHADIIEFLELKKNTGGSEEQRARDLFYGLWIPDLFMKRVKADQHWSLMCPNECSKLDDVYGDEFEELYCKYEKEERFKKQIPAREIWKMIVTSQIETGIPYMMYKDACNNKSNQKNLGTIKGPNLCTEVIEYTSPEEIACCNVASIALPKFIKNNTFDFNFLKEVSGVVTKNLNKIIDVNQYPVPEAERSNKKHRPIAVGVQGLADVFQILKLPFASSEAKLLNKKIFETIYYGAVEASCELAKEEGPYETYQGSPASTGLLQYDLWGVAPTDLWDWNSLKLKIGKNGLRNSLLTAVMPTSCTAQILGNNESIEPFTSNVYSRRVLSGDFQILNPHLVNDLVDLQLWNENMKNQLIFNEGSIQEIPEIPQSIKDIYKTVWEISQRDIIDMAADRGAFIDQSQSMNLHLAEPSYGKCTSMHFYAWEAGLKTGMYYLRSRPAADAVKFTVDKLALKINESPNSQKGNHSNSHTNNKPSQNYQFYENEQEHCVMCSG